MARRSSKRDNRQGSLYKRTAGGPWIMAWWDHDGRRRTKSTGTTDKALAGRLLSQKTDATIERRAGLVDPQAEKRRDWNAVPLSVHLADFKSYLTARGDTPGHANKTHTMAMRIFNSCKTERITHLSASATL